MTARAVAWGMLLALLNVAFLVRTLWTWGWLVGGGSFLENAVATLFIVAMVNLVLRRCQHPWALGRGEVLTIYYMVVTATGLMCHVLDLGGSLAGNMVYPFWFATDQNQWKELAWPYLAPWLTVQDPVAVNGFFLGDADAYARRVVLAWAAPAFWWTTFVSGFMWVSLCLNSIVRRRWADEEKLPFPLAALPVHMVEERLGLFRSRLFWLAFGFTMALASWNTLARLVPSLPDIPVTADYASYVEHRPPWDLIRCRALWFQPETIGLCYLMPLELAFSLLAFDLLWMAEYMVSGQLGVCTSAWSGFPYGDQQATGGFIALAVLVLWLDRRFLARVLGRGLGIGPALGGEEKEALGYRAAILGGAVGIAYLAWFLMRAGMPAGTALAFLCLYFTMVLVMSRLRAQLGPPTQQLNGTMPNFVLRALLGTRALGPRTMGVFALLNPYLQDQANHPAPSQLEALKLAEQGRMQRKRLAVALALVVPAAVLCYFWASLHFGYSAGLASGKVGQIHLQSLGWNYDAFITDLRTPEGPNASASAAMGFGMVLTALLMLLKLRFAWWPLHPLAFPIAVSYNIQGLTVAIFVTWLAKLLLLRYGGLRAHRTALPLFLGLIVGGNTFWILRGVVFQILGLSL